MAEGVWSEGIYNDSSDVLMMKASQLNTSSRDLEETLGRSDEPATRAKKNKVKSRSLDIPFGSRGSSGSGPSSPPSPPLERGEGRQSKSKVEGTDSKFLSRLFGSKRTKPKAAAPQLPLSTASSSRLEEERNQRPPRKSVTNRSSSSRVVETGAEELKAEEEHRKHQVSDSVASVRVGGGGGRSYHKQKPPPPPPSSPPPMAGTGVFFSRSNSSSSGGAVGTMSSSVTKSPSFGHVELAQDYPSLPPLGTSTTSTAAAMGMMSSDIILKKNRSLGSVLESRGHQKFHASVENWSFANEGLKRSIGSLADRPLLMSSSHSNESLKTITSLLEEPDVLVQTRVSDCAAATAAAAAALSFSDSPEQLANSYQSVRSRCSMEMQSDSRSILPTVHSTVDNPPCEGEDEEEDGDEMVHCNSNYDVIFTAQLFGQGHDATGEDSQEVVVDDEDDYVLSSEPSSFEMLVANTESRDFEEDDDSSLDSADCHLQIGDNDSKKPTLEDDRLTKETCNTNLDTVVDNKCEVGEGDASAGGAVLPEGSLMLDSVQMETDDPTTQEQQQPLVVVETLQELPLQQEQDNAQQDILEDKPSEDIVGDPTAEVPTEESDSSCEKVIEEDKEVPPVGFSVDNDPQCSVISKTQSTELPLLSTDQPTVSELLSNNEPQAASPLSSAVADSAGLAAIGAPPPLFHHLSSSDTEVEPVPQKEDLAAASGFASVHQPAKERPDGSSSKPVPAPRHFFLRPVPVAATAATAGEQSTSKSELQAVWATRRSRSMRSLVGGQEEGAISAPPVTADQDIEAEVAKPMSQKPEDNLDGESSKQEKEKTKAKNYEGSEPDGVDALINVKERARSFSSSLQNGLANFGPKPFRPPGSIVQEIRNSKPVNIPPKPKVIVMAPKPVPAPRQLRSVSGSALEAASAPAQPKGRSTGVKSTSSLMAVSSRPAPSFQGSPEANSPAVQQASLLQPTNPKAQDQSSSVPALPVPTSVAPPADEMATNNCKDYCSSQSPLVPEPQRANQLEDIHVRKLVDNFQSGGRIPLADTDLVRAKPVHIGSEEVHSDDNLMLSSIKKTDPRQAVVVVSLDGSGETTTDPLSTEVLLRRPSKSPEKPARRSREKSTERTLSASGDSGSNVMSIVSRLNALAL